ncbi:efflux RND transporter periplasmic adaptor subunit [Seohaeicola zhoushanensis]|uniref:Secretion protein HlyD n=1 Tax=Seohaeicola zhoushanensis TaxID=1569283 RepID=A0A8J3GW94_9RHOB|nr:HlyD family efflux transporter periplasmic adaptor subunit [Seohaeicola zhoushanensis]GHF47837.1 secretion protein HlyD [Seohaeicola zhoushanensis]
MRQRRFSRPILILATVALVGAGLAWAFWPRPTILDIGEVTRGPMQVTINEEGRTRVRQAYMVSTPVNGRLLRVEGLPGDPVEKDKTVVARMRPADPAVLDVRTREQALAAVDAARAATQVAEANLEAATADYDLLLSDLERSRRLAASGTISHAALDRAEGAARAAEARQHTAEAAVAQRKAELQSAEAQLIGIADHTQLHALEARLGEELSILSPSDGVILRVITTDEQILAAGAPILEVGDIREGLEAVVELISSDAVQVRVGNPVRIAAWGGATDLAGTVTRVDPFAVTKVSALGVEEQRVPVVIAIDTPPDLRDGIGHGFRIEAHIVIWQAEDVTRVPASALFREGGDWAVFVIADDTAELRTVRIGHNNGQEAEVLDGLAPGDLVALYPPAGLSSGQSVERRQVD